MYRGRYKTLGSKSSLNLRTNKSDTDRYWADHCTSLLRAPWTFIGNIWFQQLPKQIKHGENRRSKPWMIHLCLLYTEENLQINELFQTTGSLSSAGERPQWRHTFSITFVSAFVVGHLLVPWVSQAGRLSLTHCTSTKTFTSAADPVSQNWLSLCWLGGIILLFCDSSSLAPCGTLCQARTPVDKIWTRRLWAELGCEFSTVSGFPPAQNWHWCLCVMVSPQPAAKPLMDTGSFIHQWDWGENWVGKTQTTPGLRLR